MTTVELWNLSLTRDVAVCSFTTSPSHPSPRHLWRFVLLFVHLMRSKPMTETVALKHSKLYFQKGRGSFPKLPCFVESRGSLHMSGWECEYVKGSLWAS